MILLNPPKLFPPRHGDCHRYSSADLFRASSREFQDCIWLLLDKASIALYGLGLTLDERRLLVVLM